MGPPVNRIAFLVDGFNLYHSLKQAIADGGGSLKWLDLRALCQTYVNSVFGRAATLDSVYYFTAFATFLTPTNPGAVTRHRTYVTALQSTGVQPLLGRFKWKPRWCPHCRRQTPGHEEKESDVALAARLLELGVTDAADTIVLVTGDTDLIPAMLAARRLRPHKQVWVLFPYQRFNVDLRQAAHGSLKIKRQQYARHQLPDPVQLPDGTVIRKPAGW